MKTCEVGKTIREPETVAALGWLTGEYLQVVQLRESAVTHKCENRLARVACN